MILLILAQAIFLSLAMAVAWLLQRRTGILSWADPVWTLATAAAGIAGALAPIAPLTWRSAAVAAIAAAWGLRLGIHLLARSRARIEDARYAALATQWGPTAPRRMAAFLQIQAAAGLPLAASLTLAAHTPTPAFTPTDAAAALLLLVSLTGEAIADSQLRRFKAQPHPKHAICDTGLWAWSRHPNYFFEWLTWVAIALLALPSPHGWAALSAPALMYLLLVHISGIPPTEAAMRTSRGAAFTAYASRISAFFPWPPKG